MTRLFDALKKAQAGRPAAEGTPRSAPVTPLPPLDHGLRGPRSTPVRPVPGGASPVGEARPVIISLEEVVGQPDEVVREMTRLRVSIESLLTDRASRSIMFVSSQGGEGTTTVARQFAFMLARDSRIRTLLVDAHARRPSLEQGASEPAAMGSPRALDVPREPARRVIDAWPLGEQFHEVGGLSVTLMREVVEWGSGLYDWIVLDGPPVLESPDAAPIASVTDGVIVVVESGRTKRPVLRRAVQLLRKAGGQVLGSVLNRRRLEIPEFIYRRI